MTEFSFPSAPGGLPPGQDSLARPAPPQEPDDVLSGAPAQGWVGAAPVPPGEIAGRPGSSSRGHGLRGAIEWVVILSVALIGAFVIRTFLIQAFYIPSESMLPTLQKHDRVLVNKLSYSLHSVHRGDVVVFKHSPGFDPSINDLIKRVIGLPGESVSGHNGHVFINGHELTEPYLPAGTVTSDFAAKVIPAGDYWVMGDNRTNSTDSRVFGPIAKSQLVGRAFILVWPLGRLHLL